MTAPLRQIQVLARQGDDELRHMVPRHVIGNRWRKELRLINLPRSKMSAHVAKESRFAAKMPPLLGHAPRCWVLGRLRGCATQTSFAGASAAASIRRQPRGPFLHADPGVAFRAD